MISDKIPELLLDGIGVLNTQVTLRKAISLLKQARMSGCGPLPDLQETVNALEKMEKQVSADLRQGD